MLALFIVLGVVGATIGLVAFLVTRVQKDDDERVFGPLRAELGIPPGGPFAVERNGRRFEARWFRAGKHTPPTFRVTASVDEAGAVDGAAAPYRREGREHLAVRPAIILRRETGNDRLGKRLGLNREVQTGDETFDAKVYIESDSPEADVARVVGPTMRALVLKAFEDDVRRVTLDPTGLSVTVACSRPVAPQFDDLAAMVGEMAAALPVFTAGRARKPATPLLPLVAVIVGSGGMMLGIFGLDSAPIGHAAFGPGVGFGIALAVVLLGVAFARFRRRSDALRRFGLTAMGILLAVPVDTYAIACVANRKLDTAPPVEHPTTVVRRWTTRPKSTTYYHLEVASWRPGERVVPLNVSSSFYNAAKEQQGIVVKTHAGWLGWEWVDTFRLQKKD